MLPIHICENGRRLLIADSESVLADINESRFIPCVMLMTAWAVEMLSWPAFNSLVEQLLERGCTYFVCAGTYSEELHDRLDDIISSTKQKSEICTTFHNDDSLDDVVNFFVFTSDLSDLEHGGIVAMLKMSVREDRLIKDLLLTS